MSSGCTSGMNRARESEPCLPSTKNLAFKPASELAELIADKQVSPVELTALYFERIERLDGQLHAYLTLAQDEAMQAAKDAEDAVMRGDELGALHGVPISIKDLELTKGIRSTSGSLPFKDRVPGRRFHSR